MTEQLDFPFPYDDNDLATFLARYLAIEDEQDRLREDMRLLCEDFGDKLPLRAVRTAIKRVRAMRKLEEHAKEPMRRTHLEFLEGEIERHMDAAETTLQTLTESWSTSHPPHHKTPGRKGWGGDNQDTRAVDAAGAVVVSED